MLVTGGAGYIGSHTVAPLGEQGHTVIVLDSMTRGHFQAIHPKAKLAVGDILGTGWLNQVFCEHEVDGTFHFAP